MEPELSESNLWNIWSTNVFAFIPGNTALYISIILSLPSLPSGLSYECDLNLLSSMCKIYLNKSTKPLMYLCSIIICPKKKSFYFCKTQEQNLSTKNSTSSLDKTSPFLFFLNFPPFPLNPVFGAMVK